MEAYSIPTVCGITVVNLNVVSASTGKNLQLTEASILHTPGKLLLLRLLHPGTFESR